MHRGATSQDIIDTAADAARQASHRGHRRRPRGSVPTQAAVLADAHAGTVMAGRTLLQQAVPVTFGLVAAGWLTAIDEARRELGRVRATRLAIQFGGAAGHAGLSRRGRDRGVGAAGGRARPGRAGAALAHRPAADRAAGGVARGRRAALGKIARDVTLLAQTEVAEVAEGSDDPRQGGSSAMPHKRNPVRRSSFSAAPGARPACSPRWPPRPSTNISARPGHGTPNGSRCGPAAADWIGRVLVGAAADRAARRCRPDARQPGRDRGLPLAEHVAAQLAPALGRLAAQDLVAAAAARAAEHGREPDSGAARRPGRGCGAAPAWHRRAELAAAVDPAGYLGASAEFIRRALAAHTAPDDIS